MVEAVKQASEHGKSRQRWFRIFCSSILVTGLIVLVVGLTQTKCNDATVVVVVVTTN